MVDIAARQFNEVLECLVDGSHTAGSLFDAYKRLSCVLVGRSLLDDWLARAYLGTLIEAAADGSSPADSPVYRQADIVAAVEQFCALELATAGDEKALERAVSQQMVLALGPDGQPAPQLAAVAVVTKAVAALWYCAALIDQQLPSAGGLGFITRTAAPETYASALVWPAIGGNPMGIPGPYYGNWAYPSPTLIAPPDGEPERL